MIIVAGLGNPGKKYEQTRHNAGFMALDAFAKEHGFPAFKLVSKSRSFISENVLNSTTVKLAKPQTFMNNSGSAIQTLMQTKPSLIVIHDDIDIPLGTIRVSVGRGSAGHNGVESIIRELRSKNFTRIRIGIQPLTGKPENVEYFVLQKFSSTELPLIRSAIQEAAGVLTQIIEGK